jgi:D-alanyl-lipoteichoic acid acyltransferase DltB (MBOAT superfamily)
MLLLASYVFYGTWDWRFLLIVFTVTVLDYIYGIKIHEAKNNKSRKLILFLSVFCNLSILGFFKYFNFFAGSLQVLLSRFGLFIQPDFIHIILPVGISFYIFKTMTYTIDIYRKEMEPTRSFLDYALFVAFFPQILAGPIARAKDLLPQILAPRKLNLGKFYEGCYLIFWGLFQKMFIADNLARLVDPVFYSGTPYHGVDVLIAVYAFSLQIFFDFAGYSNIAIGLGECMGFETATNFNLPYFATDAREFWRRWHISLSTWLRDYLYIPLGGNRKGKLAIYRNLAITMILAGLWHGAGWTFVVWGAFYGLLLIIHRILEPFFKLLPSIKGKIGARVWLFARIALFFQIICAGWLIFRAGSISQVTSMAHAVFANFVMSGTFHDTIIGIIPVMIPLVLIVFITQIFEYVKDDLLFILHQHWAIKAAVYCLMFYLLLIYGVTGGKEFIYFQF